MQNIVCDQNDPRASAHMTGACTGFDGGLEVGEAIRGAGPRNNPQLNINADENLAYAA